MIITIVSMFQEWSLEDMNIAFELVYDNPVKKAKPALGTILRFYLLTYLGSCIERFMSAPSKSNTPFLTFDDLLNACSNNLIARLCESQKVSDLLVGILSDLEYEGHIYFSNSGFYIPLPYPFTDELYTV